jgi:hypothetical protein
MNRQAHTDAPHPLAQNHVIALDYGVSSEGAVLCMAVGLEFSS